MPQRYDQHPSPPLLTLADAKERLKNFWEDENIAERILRFDQCQDHSESFDLCGLSDAHDFRALKEQHSRLLRHAIKFAVGHLYEILKITSEANMRTTGRSLSDALSISDESAEIAENLYSFTQGDIDRGFATDPDYGDQLNTAVLEKALSATSDQLIYLEHLLHLSGSVLAPETPARDHQEEPKNTTE